LRNAFLAGAMIMMAGTDAFALTEAQKDAAVADAYLGVAEARCGSKINRTIYKLIEGQMHPSGFDQEAAQLQVAEQDKVFELYAEDPAEFCDTALRLYGPDGSAKRGLLQPR
jgi:hypothetical protein